MNEKTYYGLSPSDKFILFMICGVFICTLVIGCLIRSENIPGAVALFIYIAPFVANMFITHKLTLLELSDEFFEKIRNDVPEDVIAALKDRKYLSCDERLADVLREIIGEEQTARHKELISKHVALLLINKYSRPKRQMLIWIRRLLYGISIVSGLTMLWMWLFCDSKVFFIDGDEFFEWLFGFFL